MGARPDPTAILGGLKDFQRRTAEYTFRRMYLDPDPTTRFLVADEVGLGKTHVARGVIALAADHLWGDRSHRLDIIYVCSNSAIARQNIARLCLPGWEETRLASRITLLPLQVQALRKRQLNFISLTPGTSIALAGSQGSWEERAVLYRLLRDHWGLRTVGALNAFRGTMSADNFERRVESQAQRQPLDRDLAASFLAEVDRYRDGRHLYNLFLEVSGALPQKRSTIASEVGGRRRELIGTLRHCLAQVCISALEPDLIILDEFQRFSHLLPTASANDEEADELSLARDFFGYSDNHGDTRVLLMSATPYRMLTLEGVDRDSHYDDLLDTLCFLHRDPSAADRYRTLFSNLRRALTCSGPGMVEAVRAARDALTGSLRRVVARTERLAGTEHRGGMLRVRGTEPMQLRTDDVLGYSAFADVAEQVEHHDPVEYWKSAAYPLSFLEGYILRKQLGVVRGRSDGVELSREAVDRLALPWSQVHELQPLDPPSPRMRWLLGELLDGGAWELLWVPPSCPRYQLGDPFAPLAGFTKSLIFSAWAMVPRSIASILSYEAERRCHSSEGGVGYSRLVEAAAQPLRVAGESAASVLAHLYPSTVLSRLAREAVSATPAAPIRDLSQVVANLARELAIVLAPLIDGSARHGRPDARWYWVAPALLDRQEDSRAFHEWFGREDLIEQWLGTGDTDESEPAFARQVLPEWRAAINDPGVLGQAPEDLPEVLAWVALGGFANCALSGLQGVSGDASATMLKDAACWVADGMRGLFNTPQAVAMLRRRAPDATYWIAAAKYAAAGDLTATLAEYSHVLVESIGAGARSKDDLLHILSGEMAEAAGLRSASLTVEEFRSTTAGQATVEPRRLRTRFAVALAGERDRSGGDSENGHNRLVDVKRSFNSPFWPFVLASTSIGQEGLDFHTYCHRVVHWNLPGNPVDLEQREGRVHRYKGHAVRRNVAAHHGDDGQDDDGGDPWERMFRAARASLPAGTSELEPYWVYNRGPAYIERIVPSLPFSRDEARYQKLRRLVTVYRVAFGQSRQEDVLEFILNELSEEQRDEILDAARIDLSPPTELQ